MKIVDCIARIAGLTAALAIFLMMLLIVADVFLRAALSKPILGATEITEQMMVAVVFLGFGWSALQGKHLKVDLIVSYYPQVVQRVIDLVIIFVGLVLVAVMSWLTFGATLTVQRLGIMCSYIGVPKYPFYALATLGWGVLLVVMASLFVKNIKDGAAR